MNIKFNEISLSKIKEKCELDRRDAIDELNDEKRKTIFFSMLFFGLSLLFTIAFGVILFCVECYPLSTVDKLTKI